MSKNPKEIADTTPIWDQELEELWATGLDAEDRSRFTALLKDARPEPPQRLWYRLQQIPNAKQSAREGRRMPLPRYAVASIVAALLVASGYEYHAINRMRTVDTRAEKMLESLVQSDPSLNDVFDRDVLSLGGLQ